MKIGVVTVHDSANFGSFLQAYALMLVLRNLGHDVYFIRTRDARYVKKLFLPSKRDFIRNPVRALQKHRLGIKNRRIFLNEQKCFVELGIHETSGLDLILLGSDEIWNLNTKVFTRPVFYGIGMKPCTIAFAVSAANASAAQFSDYPMLSDAIKSLSKIAVRDDNTADIVESISGHVPPVVCDPTLMLETARLMRTYSNKYLDSNKYLVIYSYGFSTALRKVVVAFAKSVRLKIVSVCFQSLWADKNILCSPLEFLSVLSGAEFIVTSTFHGSIFSALSGRPFVSIPISIKTVDVLARLGLEERIVRDDLTPEKLAELAARPIVTESVRQKIKVMREHSMQILMEFLSDTEVTKSEYL